MKRITKMSLRAEVYPPLAGNLNPSISLFINILGDLKMKIKQSIAILSLVLFLSSTLLAVTIGTWQGAPAGMRGVGAQRRGVSGCGI
jgi:hypothetical protein